MFLIRKNILILIGLLVFTYVIIFLLAPRNITDYTIADTDYWHETANRLLLKTSYDYNNKYALQSFPILIGDWKGMDFRYKDSVYELLDADVLMSRVYSDPNGDLIYIDVINSKVGESFHDQKICVKGSGWNIDNETVSEFNVGDYSNPYKKLYANRLDISKEDEKQVIVYWFMFKKFGDNNSVAMLRISSPTINNNTIDESYDVVKIFVEKNLFKTMYENIPDNTSTVEYIINNYGKIGILGIITLLSLPIGIIVLAIRKKD